MKTQKTHASIFDLNGIPKFQQALPLALQHVVAMIVGCVTPAIIVSGVAGLSDADRIILTQSALVVSAISTLLQLFPFIKTGQFQLGSGLPVIMGISFAYVPSMQAIAAGYDVATILGYSGGIEGQADGEDHRAGDQGREQGADPLDQHPEDDGNDASHDLRAQYGGQAEFAADGLERGVRLAGSNERMKIVYLLFKFW